MEVGRLGVHGASVVKAVEPVNKNAHEAAQNLRLKTVAEIALDHREKIKRARRATVSQVMI